MFPGVIIGKVFICLVLTTSGTYSDNPLNGQHLRVLVSEFPLAVVTKRNATGHVIFIDGIEKHLLESLSRMLNFSYSFLPIFTRYFDDKLPTRGIGYYLNQNEADFSLSASLATPIHFQQADFPINWWYGPFSTLIPYPNDTTNFLASFKPYSYQVWIVIAITIFVTIFVFELLIQADKSFNLQKVGSRYRDNAVQYVIGNLFSQGNYCFSRRLTVRFAAGAWCCGCFFIVQIFSSTLTSHLTSPNQKTIIDSFFEIADKPGVRLVMDKSSALDTILQMTESEHVKRFVEVLKNDDRKMYCTSISDCLNFLADGRSVYSAPLAVLKAIADSDLKSSGMCRYTILKEEFWSIAVYTPLRKNSPYTKSIGKGIMRLRETGLLSEWEKWYVPSATKCTELNKRTKKKKLSMKHLSSTFTILMAGYILSVIAFALEKIYFFSRLFCAN